MQNDNYKKILVMVGGLLAIVALAFLLYWFLFRTPVVTPPGGGIGGGVTPGGTLPGGSGGTGGVKPPITGGTGSTTSTFKPILRKITDIPVSGGLIFEKDNKSFVRYIERAKGNTYETDATNIKPSRITNKTLVKVYETIWKNNGQNVILRFLNDEEKIQTFNALVSPKTSGEGELLGEFMSLDIKDISISPSTNQIFYLLNNNFGVSGILSSFEGKNKLQIFDSPLREWLSQFPKEDTVALTSKANSKNLGVLTFVNTKTGDSYSPISKVMGLTTLVSSDLSSIIYSESLDRDFQTKIFKKTEGISDFFPIETLPEKCVWSNNNKNVVYCASPERINPAEYPDDWYKGLVSFRDEVWKIDVSSGKTEFIMNLGSESKEDIDAINIKLNKKENFLLFMNKNDMTLWSLQIAP